MAINFDSCLKLSHKLCCINIHRNYCSPNIEKVKKLFQHSTTKPSSSLTDTHTSAQQSYRFMTISLTYFSRSYIGLYREPHNAQRFLAEKAHQQQQLQHSQMLSCELFFHRISGSFNERELNVNETSNSQRPPRVFFFSFSRQNHVVVFVIGRTLGE